MSKTPTIEDVVLALGGMVRPDGSLTVSSWTQLIEEMRKRVAVTAALDKLESELTAILGQKPELISVRFERKRENVPAGRISADTTDLVRIELWSLALPTTGRNLSVSTYSLESSVKDMLDWARKAMSKQARAERDA